MDPIPSHSMESFGSPRWATDPPAERPRRRAANPLRRPGPRVPWRPSSKKRWKDRGLVITVNIWLLYMVIILWLMMINNNLVGGFEQPTPLKNDGVKVSWDDDIPNNQYIFDGVKVSWDDDIPNNQYMEKNKCSKPPTRYGGSHMLHVWYIYLHNWVILDKGKCWYIFQHHGAYGVGWLMGKKHDAFMKWNIIHDIWF